MRRDAGFPPSGLTAFHGRHHQALECLLQLYEARADYEEFCVPMCMLPATISNNVPGTDHSIGADTSLNAIVEVREQSKTDTLLWGDAIHGSYWEESPVSLINVSGVCNDFMDYVTRVHVEGFRSLKI